MSLDALRQRVRDHARQVVTVAADLLVEEIYAQAGNSIAAGVIQTSVVESGSLLLVRINIDQSQTPTVWEWTVGHPHQPFDPHQALRGFQFDASNWREILGKDPGEYPTGNTYWFPGDHSGCQCSIDPILGDEPFDLFASAGPIVLRAFGQSILVTPPASSRGLDIEPSWWEETLTPENWTRLVEEALGSSR